MREQFQKNKEVLSLKNVTANICFYSVMDTMDNEFNTTKITPEDKWEILSTMLNR